MSDRVQRYNSQTGKWEDSDETEVTVYDIPHSASFTTPPTPKWLPTMDKAYAFTPEAKAIFLKDLAETGRIYRAAAVAGVSRSTVTVHRRSDPEFEELCLEALAMYQDMVRATIQKRAIEGDLVPIIGRVSKDQDGIIGYQRKYSDQLLMAEAKRVDPEYRERTTMDVNVRAGVLVVGAPQTQDDWLSQNQGQRLPKDPLEGLPGVSQQMIDGVVTKVHEDNPDDE